VAVIVRPGAGMSRKKRREPPEQDIWLQASMQWHMTVMEYRRYYLYLCIPSY
jgi:hypothetical protein